MEMAAEIMAAFQHQRGGSLLRVAVMARRQQRLQQYESGSTARAPPKTPDVNNIAEQNAMIITTPTSAQHTTVPSVPPEKNAPPTTFLTLPHELRQKILIETFKYPACCTTKDATASPTNSHCITQTHLSIVAWTHALEEVHPSLLADVAYAQKFMIKRLFVDTLGCLEKKEVLVEEIGEGYRELGVRIRTLEIAMGLGQRSWIGFLVLGGLVGVTAVVARMF